MLRLAIDLDDTLALYTDAFLPFAAARGYPIEHDSIYGSFVEMGVPTELFLEFESSGQVQELAPVLGSRDAVVTLAQHFDLFVLTARNPATQGNTSDWVFRHFPEIQWVTFDRDKGAACRQMKAVALIDDQIRFGEMFSPSYLIANPWNIKWGGVRGDWATITQHILKTQGIKT